MERRLAAVLAADVVGYSRLMGEDETGTLAAMKALHAELIDPLSIRHGGRIIKLMGDGILTEFPSVVAAVHFAVEMQCAIRARNEAVAEDRCIVYRIGINLGDVIAEGGDIYGDGVNIAARLEGLAEPGGICIRRAVRNQVRDRLALDFEDMGEIEVKNIARPVRVFRILLNDKAKKVAREAPDTPLAPARAPRRGLRRGLAAALLLGLAGVGGILWWQTPAPAEFERARVENMAFPLPEQPSLVVLPFRNRSPDAGDSLLVDGTTESLATGLSKIPNLFLIDNRSAAHFKDSPAPLKDISEELGVRYLLEGSLWRDGDRVKVTARLNDALAGRVAWAQEYDRGFDQIFSIQDDIARQIVTAMEVTLTEGGQAQLWRSETGSTEAYELFLRATKLFRTFSKLEVAQAQRLYEQALEIDPDFHIARVHLGWTYNLQARYAWVADTDAAWEKVLETVNQVLAAAPDHPDALGLLGFYHVYNEDFDAAVPLVDRAVSLDPNNAINVALLGRLMNVVGRPQEGINSIQRAMRLSPYYPGWFLRALGNSYQLLGDYEKAAEALESCLEREPAISEARALLAYVYRQTGETEKAARTLKELLDRNPGYSQRTYAKSMPSKDAAVLRRILAVLGELGLPEA